MGYHSIFGKIFGINTKNDKKSIKTKTTPATTKKTNKISTNFNIVNEENDLVFDQFGNPKKLGKPIAKPGGEGCVYFLRDKPEILVKIYHTRKLDEHRNEYKNKIEAMIKLKDEFNDINVCWPLLSIYDKSRKWIGYAMKQGIGAPMRYLAHAVAYKKFFPHLDRAVLLEYIISFLKNIQILHSKKVCIGDYNMLNFLCDSKDINVTMIDCDSYQIKIGKKYFPCPVGSPDLTPVEHHNIDFKNVIHTETSEAFSLAIIIFECLMLGRHPYDVVGGDDPVTNLKNGNFPYKRGNKGIPEGPWRNIWTHMPIKIKKLFIQTFTEGVNHPEKRVSLEQWIEELSIYLEDMRDGNYDKNINPLKKLIKITKKEKEDSDENENESIYENFID